jgi:uncharacterized protein (TIGR00266 family)
MAHFELNGNNEPILIVQMEKGDRVFAESDSMVAMQEGIEIKGTLKGGFFNSLIRSVTSSEDLFQQTLIAHRDAVVMLAPAIPGDIRILEVSPNKSYFLNDYAFFAGEDTISLSTALQKSIGAIFFDSDGIFILKTSGHGKLAINGMGSIEEIELNEESGDLIVDNNHLLAWDTTLNYEVEILNRGQGGLLSRAFHSLTSGEGVVMRLSGKGKVYITSRNLNSFKTFIRTMSQNERE